MSPAGYSGTPLIKKLGLKPGGRGVFVNPPPSFAATLGPLPADFTLEPALARAQDLDLVHIFSARADEMGRLVLQARSRIRPEGMVWVSWPKKASKVPTDLTEDTIRTFALANGLVDVKVCAVDDVWSGLKLVIPVKDRGAVESPAPATPSARPRKSSAARSAAKSAARPRREGGKA